jgi:hypothetical protein
MSLRSRCARALVGVALAAPRLVAQTDYYNTDAGRPLRVEDAHAIERRAVEIQVAPLRLERSAGARYQWGIEPELAIGLLPRTQLEVGVPLLLFDGAPGTRTAGAAGVDLSVLHQLNAETALPALALSANLLLPAGPFGPDRSYTSVKAIATRTLPAFRIHVNAQRTFGSAPTIPSGGVPEPGADGIDLRGAGAAELSRWMAGVSIDRPFPLQSLLLGAELIAKQPLDADHPVTWSTGAGLRHQLSPRVAVDGGAGYRFTRPDRHWFATIGAAVAVGLPWRMR